MTTNISLEALGLILTAASVLFGIVWAIFMLVRNLEAKTMSIRIDGIEKEIKQQAHVCEASLKEAKQQITEQTKAQIEKVEQATRFNEKQLDALSSRQAADEAKLATNLESINGSLADIRETTAGFGKDFMTRKECLLKEEKCFREGKDNNG